MAISEWVALGALVGVLATGWAAILVKLATLNTRLKSIELNHLPGLAKQLESLPCMEHMEEIVKLTIRLEALVARLELLEKRLRGNVHEERLDKQDRRISAIEEHCDPRGD